MGIYVARFENNGEVHWGVVENERIYPLKKNFETLKSF